MEFKDLVFTPWKSDSQWQYSQPLAYNGIADVFVFYHSTWKYGEQTYDVDQRTSAGYTSLHEDITLLELCSAVLPFCTPVTEESNDASG